MKTTKTSFNQHDTYCFSDYVAEIQKRFDVEKNAKNCAYSFIISCGMLNKFNEFLQLTDSENWHDTCKSQIALLQTCEN